MNRRLLISLLALTLGLHITGCTSSDPSKDSEESVVSSDDSFSEENSGDFENGGDNATAAKEEGGESVDDTALSDGTTPEGDQAAAAPTEGGDAAAASADNKETDELALDDGGDPANEFPDEVAGNTDATAAPADGAAPTDAAPTDTAAAGDQPTDQALFDQKAGEQPTGDQAASEPPAVTDTPADTPADTGMSSDVATNDTPVEPAPAKAYAPLLKVKDAPYKSGKTLLNRYYVARDGDTTKSVSTKIYGSNRSKDLKKWNPMLANRAMKVGDKVYYNSPKDPADESKMVSWYEEQGLNPDTYTTQEGEDIHEVAKKLFGNKDSWKELWATNMDVESKGKLPAGTELRYFPAGASESAMASNATPPPAAAPTDAASPGDMANNGQMPPPGDQGLPPDDPTLNQQPDVAMNPPPDQNMNGGTVAPPPADAGIAPPPPPPPVAAAPPPPPPMDAPPPPKPTTRAAAADDAAAGDADQTMMLGAAGLLLIGGVLAFSVIRRKRASKRIDMTQTQI